MLVMFLGWKLLKKTKVVALEEMDLETDVYAVDDGKQEPLGWKAKVKRAVVWLF